MTSSNANKPVAKNKPSTNSAPAISAQARAKNIPESITVTNGPSEAENRGDNVLEPGKIPPCTPARSALPPEVPGAPAQKSVRFLTPFDAEEGELSDCEETGDPPDSDTLGAPKNPTQTLRAAIEILRGMRTQGQNIAIKEEVLRMLDETVRQMEEPCQQAMQTPQCDTTGTDLINGIKNDIKEIKAAIGEVISGRPRTWAQVAAGTKGLEAGNRQSLEIARRERLEKARRERAKTEVVLSTRSANERVKQKLENLQEGALAESLQRAIQKNTSMTTIKISGVKKVSKSLLKLRCESEKDAVQIRDLNWGHALEGVAVVKPTCGVVVHGVSKQYIDTEVQTPEEIKARVESKNPVKVERVAPLRRKARNPDAPTHSIVIYMEDPDEADGCILDGVYLGERHHAAERFLPQCQIKQCFNCQAYGHKAEICTKKPKCGKCAQEHETRTCNSESLHCVHCEGAHAAWHYTCPRREEERRRMEALKDELSPTFAC